jgi:DnaK suppressor protein
MAKRSESIEKMQDVLLTRREEIKKILAGDLNALGEIRERGASGDAADQASESSQDEISSQLVEVECQELEKIDEALARITDKAYGVCEACDANIPIARLRALPYATFCVKCQELDTDVLPPSDAGPIDWSTLVDPT